VGLVQWALFGDNSLRRFRDQEIQIEHELCFPRCDHAITPYKVTDIIRQPRAVKRVWLKFNRLHRKRRVFVGTYHTHKYLYIGK
jgi:hypothetical protein